LRPGGTIPGGNIGEVPKMEDVFGGWIQRA